MIIITVLISTFISTNEGNTTGLIITGIIIYSLIIWGFVKTGKMKSAPKQQVEKTESGPTFAGKHVNGLPLRENATVIAKLFNNELIFEDMTSHEKFRLPIERLTYLGIETEKEFENIVKQSAPGMIVGAATFGIIGAMIGGRVKTKKKGTYVNYLLVSYMNGNEKQSVLLSSEGFASRKIVNKFKELNQHQLKTTNLA